MRQAHGPAASAQANATPGVQQPDPVPGLMPLSFLQRMHLMLKKYPTHQRDRALRMARERLDDYASPWTAAQAVGPKFGVGPETLRDWIAQA